MKLLEERLRRYEDEAGQISSTSTLIDRVSHLRKKRENNASKAIINIKNLINLDLCFVLEYIKMKKTIGVNDDPEDVLGGLNAAITKMTWSNTTRVIIHIGDAPPHGRRFTNLSDDYPDGDPNGLTAEEIILRETGKILCHIPPKTLAEVKDEYYFINSNFIEQNITFELVPQPFAVGAKLYAYFALDTSLGRANKLVIKKYHDIKIEFNIAAVRNLKKFNASSGLITEFHSILEAFVHFTYKYTEGYLVVYDLQDVNLRNEFLLTDPAIHCVDLLRFGNTNLGKSGIRKFFLANHRYFI
ncbi:8336_t:CDS:2 [Cetraspora pellucida]|uniref:8336_t:CDS:1 n=1 Tax=Cetraspora pellucida TaxID=1433469 RepID=A0A9N8ZZP5_9GLOM|nr:8336_t:CDS:2 [Cetraspora pellucida]